MKTLFITLAAAVALAFAPTTLTAMDCCNTACPVDDNPINEKVPPVEVPIVEGGQALPTGTCSKECAEKVKTESGKYSAKIWSTMRDKDAQSQIKGMPKQAVLDACCNATCPVDGKPIDTSLPPMTWKPTKGPKNPEGKSFLVGFCSQKCMDEFKAAPEKFEEPLWQQIKNKRVKGG